ncbi:MAG: hypothetical protein L6461_01965 [Anaerolineae bacterium]|nr:hypothetical protein [Anaerolineae bacterium]
MPVESTLLAHFTRYPAMQLADVYKLIHQAAMGSEHAIRDEQSARSWMTRELAEMGEGPVEPLLDLLSDETGIIRVHLRPYIASGGDPVQLLGAFISTANQHKGQIGLFETYWQAAVSLAEGAQIPFSSDEMRSFIVPLAAQGFPAVHHSSEYQKLYRPAYRVVQSGLLEMF